MEDMKHLECILKVDKSYKEEERTFLAEGLKNQRKRSVNQELQTV